MRPTAKKDGGGQRIIFDTRLSNCLFIDPPRLSLLAAGAFTSVEVPEGESFFLATSDIKNAFYSLGVPAELSASFTLQFTRARHVGIIHQ